MAYIKTEEVKEIRKALKEEFGKRFKFSVTKHNHSKVTVAITGGDIDFSTMWEGKAESDYGYGYFSVNPYYIDEARYGANAALFTKIVEIIKTAPAKAEGGESWFDESDSMTDYFHTAFYFDVEVGKWDKPYAQVT